jgi:4-amino-4-deoxychorismate lyase
MHATVSVNGHISDARTAVVSVFDHGFLYGEGVYETLRTYGRRPFLFRAHADRLRQSAALMHLPIPVTDAELLARVEATLTAHGGTDPRRRRTQLRRLGLPGARPGDHRQSVSGAA